MWQPKSISGGALTRNTILHRRALLPTVLVVALLVGSATNGLAQFTRSRSPNNEPQSPTTDRGGTTSSGRAPMPSSPITTAQQVPGAAKTSPAVASLSLEQAIQLALANNLATLLAEERENEARGF